MLDTIPMKPNDIIRMIYYHDSYSDIDIDFELFRSPTTPYGVQVMDNNGLIFLQWNASINAGDSLKYHIYRNDTILDSTYEKYFMDLDVEPLEEYTYQIQAVNEFGNSNKSSAITMIIWHDNSQIQNNKIISIYPNGIKMKNNTLYMIIDADEIFHQPQIELYNIRGQLKNKFYMNPLITGRQRVNLDGLIPTNSHSGIYFLNFCFDNDNCVRQSIIWLK